MTERPRDAGRGGLPRDTAALYAQAQVKAARFWNFSASSRQVRGVFSQRGQSEIAASAEPILSPSHAPEVQTPPRQGAQTTRRWFALNSVLFPSQPVADTGPIVETQDAGFPPLTVVVSMAGGVGKTCLVATLGRALAGVGEQVLLADRSAFGLLPFYFASREIKPGILRTFASPVQLGQQDAPVRLLSLETERHGSDGDSLADELLRHVRGASRVLLDAGPAYRGLPATLMSLRPTLLAPILPDMSSLVCLASLESMAGSGAEIYYLLNQFDASLPLHLDVRAMLQQQLGSRLLPLVLHRSPAVSEALAEGMTVIDYAPSLEIAEDYRQLAAWLRSQAAPAAVSHGSLRWTER